METKKPEEFLSRKVPVKNAMVLSPKSAGNIAANPELTGFKAENNLKTLN